MEIRSGEKYPAGALSNFARHHFEFRGCDVASMEGLLQSFKFKNPDMQLHIMSLVGKMAKAAGRDKAWWKNGLLYWQGNPFSRFSDTYQTILDEAYWNMFYQNDSAKRALLASGDSILTHSIGEQKARRTVLTRSEFTSRLMLIREVLNGNASTNNRFLNFSSLT